MFKALYLLGLPILLFFSVPLVLFAVLTTTLAFSTLLLRVSIVYLELAIAFLHSWLADEPSTPTFAGTLTPKYRSKVALSALQPQYTKPRKSRKSNSSVALHNYSRDGHIHINSRPKAENTPIYATPAASRSRDFEGVGGWRITDRDDDDAAWLSMNSRLELPVGGEHQRRHRRSLTSQSQRFARSPEAIRMSPVESRNRTPPGVERDSVEYFDFSTAAMSPEESAAKNRMEERRKSISSCSTSSNTSLVTLRTGRPGR